MHVVDEEIFKDTNLETTKDVDQEDVKPQDVPSSIAPVDEESAPPPLLERAPLPEPEFIGPEEKEFIPVKPKRKPRKNEKPEVLVPALEKPPEAFKETSKLRKDRLKEQIE